MRKGVTRARPVGDRAASGRRDDRLGMRAADGRTAADGQGAVHKVRWSHGRQDGRGQARWPRKARGGTRPSLAGSGAGGVLVDVKAWADGRCLWAFGRGGAAPGGGAGGAELAWGRAGRSDGNAVGRAAALTYRMARLTQGWEGLRLLGSGGDDWNSYPPAHTRIARMVSHP